MASPLSLDLAPPNTLFGLPNPGHTRPYPITQRGRLDSQIRGRIQLVKIGNQISKIVAHSSADNAFVATPPEVQSHAGWAKLQGERITAYTNYHHVHWFGQG